MRRHGPDENSCAWTLFCCLPNAFLWLNRSGAIPFSFHSVAKSSLSLDPSPVTRKHHFTATAVWSVLASLGAMAAYVGYRGFAKSFQEEKEWYQGLSEEYHQGATLITLGAFVFIAASILSSLYKCYDHFQKTGGPVAVRDRNDDGDDFFGDDGFYNGRAGQVNAIPLVRTRNGTEVGLEASERTHLVASHGKVSPCHPARTCVPMRPYKVFLWMTVLGAAGTALAMVIKPEIYKQLVNSDFMHYGAASTLALSASALTATLFTGLHYGLSKAEDTCCSATYSDGYNAFS